MEYAVACASLKFLANHCPHWDELVLSGIGVDSPLLDPALIRSLGLRARITEQSAAKYVDIARLNANNVDYLSTLSGNTRYQLRRALRGFQHYGTLETVVAQTPEEGLGFFEELREWHQGYWLRKGYPGAFGDHFALRFHKCLIRNRLPCGEIQLLRINAGERVIGYIYNFVKDGIVYNYQSGFRYEDDAKLKPGIVCHYAAIELNRKAGVRRYDLLAGESRYKRSLAKSDTGLLSVVLQRDRMKFRLENMLRTAKNRLVT